MLQFVQASHKLAFWTGLLAWTKSATRYTGSCIPRTAACFAMPCQLLEVWHRLGDDGPHVGGQLQRPAASTAPKRLPFWPAHHRWPQFGLGCFRNSRHWEQQQLERYGRYVAEVATAWGVGR